MEKPFIKLDDTEIEKQKFHQYKISIENIHINKKVASKKVSFSKKSFQ